MFRPAIQAGVMAALFLAASPTTGFGTASSKAPDSTTGEDLSRATARLYAEIEVQAEAERRMQQLRQRGFSVPEAERTKLDAMLRAVARRADREADTFRGEDRLSRRLAARFGMTQDSLLRQREESGQGWGDEVIAHALAASAPEFLDPDELLEMHAEGTMWGHIAAGLGLGLPEVRAAVSPQPPEDQRTRTRRSKAVPPPALSFAK